MAFLPVWPFEKKTWTRVFHSPHLNATISSSSLLTPPPFFSLLPSLPLSALPINSLCWHLQGSCSLAPLPCACWCLIVVLPPVVLHLLIHLRLLPHLHLLSHLCIMLQPSCLVGCCISQRLSLSIFLCRAVASTIHHVSTFRPAPLLLLVVAFPSASPPPSWCGASRLLFVTALGFVCCCFCSRIYLVQGHLPQSKSGASPNWFHCCCGGHLSPSWGLPHCCCCCERPRVHPPAAWGLPCSCWCHAPTARAWPQGESVSKWMRCSQEHRWSWAKESKMCGQLWQNYSRLYYWFTLGTSFCDEWQQIQK